MNTLNLKQLNIFASILKAIHNIEFSVEYSEDNQNALQNLYASNVESGLSLFAVARSISEMSLITSTLDYA